MIAHFGPNRRGIDYVVGDIHGCHDSLMAALRRVHFDETRDRLFSVGDLIDRGPQSLECLTLVYQPWFHAVRGNHETLAYTALTGGSSRDMDLWLLNGGTWIHREDVSAVRSLLHDAWERMPVALDVEVDGARVGIVHAEPPSDWRQIEAAGAALSHQLVWSRARIGKRDTSTVQGVDLVVVGHTIVEAPTVLGNVHYIDTGAFAARQGGYLTLERLADLVAVVRKTDK